MTALTKYQRLEAAGLWRASPEAQRRDVIVSVGDATLIVTDMQDRPLAHWSLAAVARANPGEYPAIFYPDGDPGETLELAEDEREMLEAIETLRRVIEHRRPHPGRLRWGLGAGLFALVLALALLWLPGALRQHALSILPDVKREEIGQALLTRIERVSGAPCAAPEGRAALRRLGQRVLGPRRGGNIVVLRDGLQSTAHLPGGFILLDRSIVEDPSEPDVTAGYLLAEELRRRAHDPLAPLLRHAGTFAALRLLTTGEMSRAALDSYAERLLTAPPAPLRPETLLPAFEAAELRVAPYAYALDVTGESVVALIEADPFAAAAPRPVLPDADWLRLQSICGA